MSSHKTTKDFHKQRLISGKGVGILNLGCSRNLIDSQTLLEQIQRKGHRITELDDCDVAVVNTCAFVEDAKKESIDAIVDLLELKKQGKIKKVIVAGCLAQRYSSELLAEFKDIDAIVGVQKLDRDSIPSNYSLTPKHYAYVKISESCYNRCKFCIIPAIKGKFVSRTIESVLSEVKQLDEKGVKEINIIGQDITAYGMDVYKELSLARLLREIVKVTNNIQWIRLLYAFPAHVTDELIDVIAAEEKICPYIDIPLQHINNDLLERMNRNITTEETYVLIKRIRQKIPQASLRTAFIVGLPGETDQNFEQLLEFVKEMKFEKAGAFIYSPEEGTEAYDMPDQILDSIKQIRFDKLMQIQQDISKEIMEKYVGQTMRVLIDEKQKDEDDVYLGRTIYDAPEVDGIVYVKSQRALSSGDFVDVKITDSLEYDLVGEVV